MAGRVVWVLDETVRKEHRLRSYELEAVCEDLLGDREPRLPRAAEARLCAGGVDERTMAALRVTRRASIPLTIVQRLDMLVDLVEMARVTGVPPAALLHRGQQYKVLSQLCRACSLEGFLIPAPPASRRRRGSADGGGEGAGYEECAGGAGGRSGGGDAVYQGATVLEARAGAYTSPIATLDFASLYPSIIIAHNLSYETLILHPDDPAAAALRSGEYAEFSLTDDTAAAGRADTAAAAADDDEQESTWGVPAADPPAAGAPASGGGAGSVPGILQGGRTRFVTAATAGGRPGLLPSILTRLLRARAAAKRGMAAAAAAGDDGLRRILDGRQRALKVSCNSVYGFCGAAAGPLPCVALAATVTAVGRGLIARAREIIESEFTAGSGRVAADAAVIYGDTDSVMVDFHVPVGPGLEGRAAAVRQAARLGGEAAAAVTRAMRAPIRLELEKVYMPYLLFSKKRYAGLLFPADGADPGPGRVDVKGVETVRRDSCEFVQEVYSQCLEILLGGPGAAATAAGRSAKAVTTKMAAAAATAPVAERVAEAVRFARAQAAALRDGQVPGSKLVMCTALVRRNYKSKTPHGEVVRRVEARGDAVYQIGDRVQFVKIAGPGYGSTVADQCEEPVYALENNFPIDYEWYLTNQLKQPLVKLFQILISSPERDLFGGMAQAAGRVVKQFRPQSDVMRRFFVPTAHCAGCEAPLKAKGQSKSALCPSCEPDREDFIMSSEANVMEAEHIYGAAMAVCTACTSGYGEGMAGLCRNVGCEHLYRRDKAAHDVADRRAQLQALLAT